jgi:hypothetical protein
MSRKPTYRKLPTAPAYKWRRSNAEFAQNVQRWWSLLQTRPGWLFIYYSLYDTQHEVVYSSDHERILNFPDADGVVRDGISRKTYMLKRTKMRKAIDKMKLRIRPVWELPAGPDILDTEPLY